MRRLCVGVLVVAVWMVSTAYAGPAVDMKEGQWELTIETEITGMPMKLPPVTYRQCMSKSEPVPENQQPDQECEVTDMKTTGNTVSWVVKCDTSGEPTTGTGKVTYQGDKMTGVMTTETQGMKMTNHMKGHYVGPCSE